MIPTLMIKKHMAQLEGPELDQLLVSLYQTYQETQQPILPRDKTVRMERFEHWLDTIILKNNEKMETMKVERIFAQDLPKLRAAWKKIRAKANGEEK